MMKIREATQEDIEALKTLEKAIVDAERPFNSSIKSTEVEYYDLPSLVADPYSHFLVAEDNSKIVATGYIQIRESKPWLEHDYHGYLGFMYVDPDSRGQGHITKILNKLLIWGKTLRIEHYYLDVYCENEPAIKAYEKAGFKSSMMEMKLKTPKSS